MKTLVLTLLGVTITLATSLAVTDIPSKTALSEYLTVAANGIGIPHPSSTKTYPVKDGSMSIAVPEAMVYVPSSKPASGLKPSAEFDGYCIGKFPVTNAEYKEFLEETHSTDYPVYWSCGTYPDGKANHPVVYVSLKKALAYAAWVSQKTGWRVTIPTSQQWERAARGPKEYLYPWGNSMDVSFSDGVLNTKFNFNAVTATRFLKEQPKLAITYNNAKSKYYGTKATVEQIAGYDESGTPTYLSVSPTGSVRGWVNHATYTGFIYTDLFAKLNATGGNTTPVGSYEAGKSAYGCYDMAGNVWNWCNTLIIANNGAEKGKSVNEIRGGSWYATGHSCQSVSIGEGRSATGAYNTVGFRLVMLPITKGL